MDCLFALQSLNKKTVIRPNELAVGYDLCLIFQGVARQQLYKPYTLTWLILLPKPH